jgi:hypothetical protein
MIANNHCVSLIDFRLCGRLTDRKKREQSKTPNNGDSVGSHGVVSVSILAGFSGALSSGQRYANFILKKNIGCLKPSMSQYSPSNPGHFTAAESLVASLSRRIPCDNRKVTNSLDMPRTSGILACHGNRGIS